MPDLRSLPPVHALLADPELASAVATRGRQSVVAAIRSVLDQARQNLSSSRSIDTSRPALVAQVRSQLGSPRPTLRPVINATGVLLHTGLGRAPLAPRAVAAVAAVAAGYSSLEFDLATGQRGDRSAGIARRIADLTGAESSAVVNNNAAATLIALKALAAGREVIVSRGQLVEIGGSYRLPEVFEASGARLREVGTTNRTRLDDYERAIGPDTAALLRVHTSNYRIVGFTEEVAIDRLAALARARGILCIDDLGSGALAPGLPAGLIDEPTVRESIAAGADLALFSGDKLLGGPQAGLLVGRRSLIDRVRADPLMRALRVDKMTLAALEATLDLLAVPDRAIREIPLWRFLSRSVDELRIQAERMAASISRGGFIASAVPSESQVGGGSAPHQTLPSFAIRVIPPLPLAISLDELATTLRSGEPSIVARVQKEALWIDPRTLLDGQEAQIITAFLMLGQPTDDSELTRRPICR